jgi:hypothetical protein
MTDQLGENFEKNLKILNLAHPNNPQATAGVGFIVNKQLIKLDDIELHKLILGRAAMLKL